MVVMSKTKTDQKRFGVWVTHMLETGHQDTVADILNSCPALINDTVADQVLDKFAFPPGLANHVREALFLEASDAAFDRYTNRFVCRYDEHGIRLLLGAGTAASRLPNKFREQMIWSPSDKGRLVAATSSAFSRVDRLLALTSTKTVESVFTVEGPNPSSTRQAIEAVLKLGAVSPEELRALVVSPIAGVSHETRRLFSPPEVSAEQLCEELTEFYQNRKAWAAVSQNSDWSDNNGLRRWCFDTSIMDSSGQKIPGTYLWPPDLLETWPVYRMQKEPVWVGWKHLAEKLGDVPNNGSRIQRLRVEQPSVVVDADKSASQQLLEWERLVKDYPQMVSYQDWWVQAAVTFTKLVDADRLRDGRTTERMFGVLDVLRPGWSAQDLAGTVADVVFTAVPEPTGLSPLVAKLVNFFAHQVISGPRGGESAEKAVIPILVRMLPAAVTGGHEPGSSGSAERLVRLCDVFDSQESFVEVTHRWLPAASLTEACPWGVEHRLRTRWPDVDLGRFLEVVFTTDRNVTVDEAAVMVGDT